ncbi:hypothetical protein Tco_1273383 [Tanacetum coccineum]
MGDVHLSNYSESESLRSNKVSVEDLVPIPNVVVMEFFANMITLRHHPLDSESSILLNDNHMIALTSSLLPSFLSSEDNEFSLRSRILLSLIDNSVNCCDDAYDCPIYMLRSDLGVSFPSGTRNKIFDPGIFFEVQSKRFLSPNEFSISFIRDPLSLVFDTLLLFSSENEDNVFNPGILASNEKKSPHLLSHRGFKAFQLIFESPMMISGGDIPILDVLFLHFYPL